MELVVLSSGAARCVYDEAIPLHLLGRLVIRRASYVEAVAGGSGWKADLTPAGGPVLGPFRLRSEAVRTEQDWLEAYWLMQSR